MDLLLATTETPLLLVNLVFAALALAVGFAAGAWVCGGQGDASPPEECVIDESPENNADQLNLERSLLASDRLRDLATNVASEVGNHSENINLIEAELAAAGPNAEAVGTAIKQISDANSKLKDRLAKAEEQIKAQAELIKTQESEARTDSLTSLANRRAFDDELMRRYAEWERKGTPFSLLILDVDHFKQFNDTHGHQAGDEVLREVGKALIRCAREMDLACRYGGEEFAVIMPATQAVDGGVLAERVRSTIEAMEIEFEGKTLSVTASIGLAGCEGAEDTNHVVRRSDDALYTSKDAGRNNAHRHTGTECVPITPGRSASASQPSPPAEAVATAVLDSLPNRTRFLEMLRNEVRAAQDANTPLAVLTADFEGYSNLAAEFGDAVARLTLDSIAQFLQSSIQEEDRLGRLDDGQFILMLPRRSASDAREAGARINTALSNCSVPLGNGQLRLSTGMCVTELSAADTAVSLMQRAEASIEQADASEIEPVLAG